MNVIRVLLFVLTVCRPSVGAEPLRLNGQTMGTYYSIVIDVAQAGSPAIADNGTALQAQIEARLAEVNRQMSTWDPASEISTFNTSESTDWFPVSADFAGVVAEARAVHQKTNGAFDPSVAPLIDLWGFGRQRAKDLPTKDQIRTAMESVGMQHVEVRMDPPALKKAMPALQLNLFAIAKGYGVDAVAELLVQQGYQSFIVDIGGEDRAGKAKSDGTAWKIGVESPLGGLNRILEFNEVSIATSGDYRNFVVVDDVKYSHAVDPLTGWPVKTPPASVSVTHQSCMTADAWATAMMVLGSEKGAEIARQNELSVMFQELVDGNVRETSTGRFAEKRAATATVESNVDAKDSSEATTLQEQQSDTPATVVSDAPSETAGSQSMPWFPFVAAAVIFVVALGGMAIGTMLQNKQLKGSCGGLASMPGSEGKSICELCTIPKDQCTNAELREKMQQSAAKAAACDDHT